MVTQEELEKMSPEEIAKLQRENCIFCKIIKGEIPSKKVYEDDATVAILDINPARKGHVLVMPKEHYPILPLVPPDAFKKMFEATKLISAGLKKAMLVNQTTIFLANGAVAGQQSPHFLFHVIPREQGDGLDNFTLQPNPAVKADNDSLLEPLKNNLTIMMKKFLQQIGKTPNQAPGAQTPPPVPSPDSPPPVSTSPAQLTPEQVREKREKIAKILEDNQQVRDMIMNDPQQFLQTIATNQELTELFAGVDINALAANLKQFQANVADKQQTQPSSQPSNANLSALAPPPPPTSTTVAPTPDAQPHQAADPNPVNPSGMRPPTRAELQAELEIAESEGLIPSDVAPSVQPPAQPAPQPKAQPSASSPVPSQQRSSPTTIPSDDELADLAKMVEQNQRPPAQPAQPQPEPKPNPASQPAPKPQVKPEPKPAPKPEPTPQPTPKQASPQPKVAPVSEPKAVSSPGAMAYAKPKTTPSPKPVPTPEPEPQPVPHPDLQSSVSSPQPDQQPPVSSQPSVQRPEVFFGKDPYAQRAAVFKYLEEKPRAKQLLMDDPKEFVHLLEQRPDVQHLFDDVDVKKLAQKLKEIEGVK